MLEVLWLLLPVAAASGWIAARRSAGVGDGQVEERDPAYLQGLNYLLNEQPDKAIDVFVKLLEVDAETVETHLALGNLFRRRGEVDRAIRIHQNLYSRPALPMEVRDLALLELGQDYMRAGVFDRAEGLFQELADRGRYREKALANLQEIYQQEKDWVKCLAVARQLEKVSGRPYGREIAHYHCELAEEAVVEGDLTEAHALACKALNSDRRCVRATLLRGRLACMEEDLAKAITIYKKVPSQDLSLVSEILPPLLACYQRLDDERGLQDYLRWLYQQSGDTRVLLAYADVVQRERGDRAAIEVVAAHLQRRADLMGLRRLIRLEARHSGDPEQRDTLQLLHGLVDRLIDRRPPYRCGRCGFTARHLHWQCPGCKRWDTLRPTPAEEMDCR